MLRTSYLHLATHSTVCCLHQMATPLPQRIPRISRRQRGLEPSEEVTPGVVGSAETGSPLRGTHSSLREDSSSQISFRISRKFVHVNRKSHPISQISIRNSQIPFRISRKSYVTIRVNCKSHFATFFAQITIRKFKFRISRNLFM